MQKKNNGSMALSIAGAAVVALVATVALVAALTTVFVASPVAAQEMPIGWWAVDAAPEYEVMSAWAPVGTLDYDYEVQGLEDTLGATADFAYGNAPNYASGNFAGGNFAGGNFAGGNFAGGNFDMGVAAPSSSMTKSAAPVVFQQAPTKGQRVMQSLQPLQEQMPETTATPKYLQPVIKTHVIDQPVIQPKIVRQPIIQQRLVEQPIVRTRVVNQPVIRRIVTQPVLQPRIIQQTQYQPQYIDQPVVQPRIIEQTIVREQLMEKQQQNQPIVSAPVVTSKKGGASYQSGAY